MSGGLAAAIAFGCSFLIEREDGWPRYAASIGLFLGGMACGYLIGH